MQPEIAVAQPKMSTKKCACFTPSGLVYTRLETDGTIARRPSDSQKKNNTRTRRSIGEDNEVYEPNTVESILKENPSIGHLSFKNEYINELENKDLKDKIDELIAETEAFLEAYERTKENTNHKRMKRRAQHWNHNKHKQRNDAITNSNESSLECKIDKNGQVNCSQVIYNDLKAWHTNRLSLEDQIRQLRTKLEDLKEIKRHLKTTKPAVEAQTMQPIHLNNHLHNRSLTHEHNSSKEHYRKSRLHRIRSKHRNNTLFDKKFRQSNEYVMPTINANIKDDIFNVQLKNETTTEAITQNYSAPTEVDETTKHINVLGELPKPQVTTIIIDGNYFEQSRLHENRSTEPSTVTSSQDVTTTEYTKFFETTHTANTKRITEEDTTVNSSPVDFSKNLNYFNSAIDKILSTEKSTVITKTETATTSNPITNKPTTFKPVVVTANLGPARLDASEFENRNSNTGISNNMGIFSKPVDLFQRRLHPLFIENEDKHVCYCEESR